MNIDILDNITMGWVEEKMTLLELSLEERRKVTMHCKSLKADKETEGISLWHKLCSSLRHYKLEGGATLQVQAKQRQDWAQGRGEAKDCKEAVCRSGS